MCLVANLQILKFPIVITQMVLGEANHHYVLLLQNRKQLVFSYKTALSLPLASHFLNGQTTVLENTLRLISTYLEA